MKNNTNKTTETQDEVITEMNHERQPYLDLLKSLDDWSTAREFRDEKINRAKDLVSQILMVTCGAFVRPENKDWAHEHLIEILEMFMVRHKNFDRSQFAEDLQEQIYVESMAYSDSSINWKKAVLAERGLGEYGIALAKPVETEPALDLSDSSTEDLAQKLSDIMHNPNLPKEIQEYLEVNLSLDYIDFHTPENILGNLKQLSKSGGEK